jgi:hypothetical protein
MISAAWDMRYGKWINEGLFALAHFQFSFVKDASWFFLFKARAG